MCNEERCFAVRGEDFVANITISSPDVHTELISENIVFILGIGVNLPMEYPHDVKIISFTIKFYIFLKIITERLQCSRT